MTPYSRQFAKPAISLLLTSALVFGAFGTAPVLSKAKTDKITTGSVARQTKGTFGAKTSAGGSVNIRAASHTLKAGLGALRKKNMRSALSARKKLRSGTLEHKVLGWAIAVNGRDLSAQTLISLASEFSEWPQTSAIRYNIEKALVRENGSLRVAFSQSNPQTTDAAIALAKSHLKQGNRSKARAAVAPFWRSKVLTKSQESTILKSMAKVLTREDHRVRLDYLLTKRRIRAAERIAGLAGATRLTAARAAVERKQSNAAQKLAAVPAFQRSDPNYLFSKARYLRRKNRLSEAAGVLLAASSKSIHAGWADHFWTEQRIVAADLVEVKKYRLAYKLASRNLANSSSKRIDAEFYAGWIALRKIGDAKTAARHFERLLKIASTPLSKSRGYYWLGRAFAKAGNRSGAVKQYSAAARYDTTYYGQLAARKLGASAIKISRARPTTNDRVNFQKYELVQAIAKLESAGYPRRARPIYRFLAYSVKQPGILALLAARAERRRDYQLSLQIGKAGFIRGKPVDALAWPIGAIPTTTRTGSAGLALAYAISRQESTFQVDARSHANALGLMQLLPTTAKNTARKIGVKFSRHRLVTDAGYNALLGTSYLGEQLKRFGSSYILTFVAYNAGPLRAKEWIQRFGDPRGASTDFAVDWVEQIPYSETRNYVQRVMENLQVYQTRLHHKKLTIDRDLTRGNRA